MATSNSNESAGIPREGPAGISRRTVRDNLFHAALLVLCVGLFLYFVGVRNLMSALFSIRRDMLILAVAILVANSFIRALQWRLAVPELSFAKSLILFTQGTALSAVTPFGLGQFSPLLHGDFRKVSIAALIVYQRIFLFVAYGFAACLGALTYFNRLRLFWGLLAVVLGAALLTLIFQFRISLWGLKLLPVAREKKEYLEKILNRGMRQITPRLPLFSAFLLLNVAITVIFVKVLFVGGGADPNPPISAVAAGLGASFLAGIVAIVPSGMGLTELVGTLAFHRMGIAAKSAAAVLVLNRVLPFVVIVAIYLISSQLTYGKRRGN